MITGITYTGKTSDVLHTGITPAFRNHDNIRHNTTHFVKRTCTSMNKRIYQCRILVYQSNLKYIIENVIKNKTKQGKCKVDI